MSDEHYTPQPIYDLILNHFQIKYGVQKENIVRPFYPGGNYKSYPYKECDLVFDNPPFSIMKDILEYYNYKGIKYILYYDSRYLFTENSYKCGMVITGVKIKYHDGLRIPTSFVTNLFDDIYCDNELKQKINKYYKRKSKSREVDWYTSEDLQFISRRQNVKIPRCAIDGMSCGGSTYYGGAIHVPNGIDQFKERGGKK